MNKITLSFVALAFAAASAFTANAEVAKPTVRPGDFHCFRGMPEEQINYLPGSPSPVKVMRGKKLGNSKFDNTDGHDLREVNTSGAFSVPVILVNFQNVQFTENYPNSKEIIDEMLNGENFTYQKATGSVKAYYEYISKGQFSPQFDVYGPVTLSKPEVDYVQTNKEDTYIDPATGKEVVCYPAGRMVEEAVKLLDDEIDFSKYDYDGDGYTDFVYFFFAGQGATTGGNSNTTVWPHAFTLDAAIGGAIELDGVYVNRYCCSSELGSNSRLSGIGTFCHEFAHVLGLPDLYDTANNGTVSACFTPGSFSNMDAGNYNNKEHTPPMFSSYEQYAMEWMKPTDLTAGGHFTMLPLEAHPFAYKVPSTNNPQEYFLIENRGYNQQDQYLDGHGILVWHIDFDLNVWTANTPNNAKDHQRIDIIEADNSKSSSSRGGDVFPGDANVCEFLSSVTPSFRDWSNKPVGIELWEIEHHFDGTTSFLAKATSGKVMDGVEIAAPKPSVVATTPNSIELEWPAVKGAQKYFVSIFEASKLSGDILKYADYENGIYFKEITPEEVTNGHLSITLSDLRPNVNYAVMLYAAGELNASRMQAPVTACTVDGSDFKAAATNLYLGSADDLVIAVWDEVENADDYEFSIITRAKGEETTTLEFGFDGGRLPEGWKGSGKFESNTRYCGLEAPAYNLNSNHSYLASPIGEEQIQSIAFQAQMRYNDPNGKLDIYTADKNGNYTLFTTFSDKLSNSSKLFFIDLPGNVYGVKLLYRYNVTDLTLFVDDFKVIYCSDAVDTPVEFEAEKVSSNQIAVKGLEANVEYIAYVTPMKGGEPGLRSNEVTFMTANLPASGVEEVAASNLFSIDGMIVIPAEGVALSVYTIDGFTLKANAGGSITIPARGIYLIKANETTTKVQF